MKRKFDLILGGKYDPATDGMKEVKGFIEDWVVYKDNDKSDLLFMTDTGDNLTIRLKGRFRLNETVYAAGYIHEMDVNSFFKLDESTLDEELATFYPVQDEETFNLCSEIWAILKKAKEMTDNEQNINSQDLLH